MKARLLSSQRVANNHWWPAFYPVCASETRHTCEDERTQIALIHTKYMSYCKCEYLQFKQSSLNSIIWSFTCVSVFEGSCDLCTFALSLLIFVNNGVLLVVNVLGICEHLCICTWYLWVFVYMYLVFMNICVYVLGISEHLCVNVLGICEHLYAHASRCVQRGQRGQRHFFAGDSLLFSPASLPQPGCWF